MRCLRGSYSFGAKIREHPLDTSTCTDTYVFLFYHNCIYFHPQLVGLSPFSEPNTVSLCLRDFRYWYFALEIGMGKNMVIVRKVLCSWCVPSVSRTFFPLLISWHFANVSIRKQADCSKISKREFNNNLYWFRFWGTCSYCYNILRSQNCIVECKVVGRVLSNSEFWDPKSPDPLSKQRNHYFNIESTWWI